MSLSLEDLRRRVVAIPGDLLLCPECREPLLLFTGRTFSGAQVQPAARKVQQEPGRFTLWCRCGAGSCRDANRSKRIEGSVGPRIFVRSGSWTGWRALGGE